MDINKVKRLVKDNPESSLWEAIGALVTEIEKQGRKGDHAVARPYDHEGSNS